MAWRKAKSLVKLNDQLNTAHPNRSKASDGFIGDAAHFKEGSASDHNPWLPGEVVSAFDITHDPANGVDIGQLAEQLVASRDPRIKYIIANGRITGPQWKWVWQEYNGSNLHTKHLHISANTNNYDDTSEWSIGNKGDEMIGDLAHLNALFQRWLRRGPSADDAKNYVGKFTYARMVEMLDQHPEHKAAEAKVSKGLALLDSVDKGRIKTLTPEELADYQNWKNSGIQMSAQLKATTEKLNQLAALGDISAKQQAQLDKLNNENATLLKAKTSLEADKAESMKVGERVVQWLGSLFKSK